MPSRTTIISREAAKPHNDISLCRPFDTIYNCLFAPVWAVLKKSLFANTNQSQTPLWTWCCVQRGLFQHSPYDLEIDTHIHSLKENIEQISKALKNKMEK